MMEDIFHTVNIPNLIHGEAMGRSLYFLEILVKIGEDWC